MSASVYIVWGRETGYEPADWPVIAYLDEGKAKNHVEAATREGRAIDAKLARARDRMTRAGDDASDADWDRYERRRDRLLKSNRFDPDYRHECDYAVVTVELATAPMRRRARRWEPVT